MSLSKNSLVQEKWLQKTHRVSSGICETTNMTVDTFAVKWFYFNVLSFFRSWKCEWSENNLESVFALGTTGSKKRQEMSKLAFRSIVFLHLQFMHCCSHLLSSLKTRATENNFPFEPNLKESGTDFSKSIQAPHSVLGLKQVLPLWGTLLTSLLILPLCFLIPGVLSSSELSKSPLGDFTCWQIGLSLVQWLYLEPVWGPAIFTGMSLSPVANADPCHVFVHSPDQLVRYQMISLLFYLFFFFL